MVAFLTSGYLGSFAESVSDLTVNPRMSAALARLRTPISLQMSPSSVRASRGV